MPPRPSTASTGRTRRLVVVLGAQAALLLALVGYRVGLGQEFAPDGGLRQLDMFYLDAAVPGLAALGGRPTMVVATGDLSDPRCAKQVQLAARQRGQPTGLDPAYPLVLLLPVAPAPAEFADLPGLVIRVDPGGRLAARLALAGAPCRPGYALVDPLGRVRYRTYDPQWAEHTAEQEILLAALR